LAWRDQWQVTTITGLGRVAIAGRPTARSSLKVVIFSRVIGTAHFVVRLKQNRADQPDEGTLVGIA
jgi:hypothetical protein